MLMYVVVYSKIQLMQALFLQQYAPEGHFVYVLLHRTAARFKIGRTCNPRARITDLGGRAVFDDTESLIFYVGNLAQSVAVEEQMHAAFQAHRLVGEHFAPTSKGGKVLDVFYAATLFVFDRRLQLGDKGSWGAWSLADFYARRPITPLAVIDE